MLDENKFIRGACPLVDIDIPVDWAIVWVYHIYEKLILPVIVYIAHCSRINLATRKDSSTNIVLFCTPIAR